MKKRKEIKKKKTLHCKIAKSMSGLFMSFKIKTRQLSDDFLETFGMF